MSRGQKKGPNWTVDTYKNLSIWGRGCQNTEKKPTAFMYNKRKKGVDFETTSFMNGPLVRASGHVIHAHSPLLPSWSPELYCCVHTAVKT